MWHNLDLIYPWDFLKDERKIKTDNNLNGINYLTEVHVWGNAGDGPGFGKQEIRKTGPDGYLRKFYHDR